MFLSSLKSKKLNRWQHFAAMALIGDGVIGIIRPGRDAEAWAKGPWLWKEAMRELSERPALTRLIAAAEIAGAVYWILAHEDPK